MSLQISFNPHSWFLQSFLVPCIGAVGSGRLLKHLVHHCCCNFPESVQLQSSQGNTDQTTSEIFLQRWNHFPPLITTALASSIFEQSLL
ncbi:hypothetical protein SLA2020_225700 [Shorea laevis]